VDLADLVATAARDRPVATGELAALTVAGSRAQLARLLEQAVRSYAAGHWPTADLKASAFPLLGDHFGPIRAVLAPFYLLHRGPETLLVAQAFLLAVSVVPVTRLATDCLGARAGVLIGLGLRPVLGLLHAVRFDFHEVCFAVPLVAFALERLVCGRWGAAVAFAVPLVLVKEDLPWTVVAIGLYLVARRQGRLGVALVVFGAVVGALVVLVVEEQERVAALPGLNYRVVVRSGDVVLYRRG
jgi:uncharacterized membrane protein